MITTRFQVKLKAYKQWDLWVVDLEMKLKIIVGAQGIPLSDVIRDYDSPDQTERDTWEEKEVLAVPLTGII